MPDTLDPPEAIQRPASLEHRSFSGSFQRVRAEGEGEAADTAVRYDLILSTDNAVELWPGLFEILDHSSQCVRLDWLKSGNAPFLWMHDRYQIRGVIESAELEGGNLKVRVKMSESDASLELIKDIDSGVIRNASVGYRTYAEKIDKTVTDPETGATISRTWRVTDWEPKEGSFVTIPADPGAGFRAEDSEQVKCRVRFLEQQANASQQQPTATRITMPDVPPAPPAAHITVVESDTQRNAAVTAERARIAGIQASADAARKGGLGDFSERARKAIDDGEPLADFNSHVLGNMTRTTPPTTEEIGLTGKEQKRYLLTNVIEGMVDGDKKRYEFEAEVSRAAQEMMGHGNGERIAIPMDVLLRGWIPKDPSIALRMGWGDRERTLVQVGSAGAAANLVPRELMPEMFIHSLRETQVLLARATYLPGLIGDVDIPIELTNPIFYWVGEDTEPTDGAWTSGQVQFRFKTVAARIAFTRRAEKQTLPGIEGVLAGNLRQGYGLAVEKKAFSGAASSTQPGGVYSTSGIGDVTSGGVLTFANALELRTDVAAANAPVENCEFYTSSKGVGLMRGTGIVANDAQRIAQWGADGKLRCEGRIVNETNLSPDNLGGGTNKTGILYGDASSIYVGLWGALEIMLDTATKVATGGKVLRVFGDTDIQIPQPARWSAIQDLS